MLSFVLPELSFGQPSGVSALSQDAERRPPGGSWEDDLGFWQAPEELRSRGSAYRVQLQGARRCVQLAYEADSSITLCEAARDLTANVLLSWQRYVPVQNHLSMDHLVSKDRLAKDSPSTDCRGAAIGGKLGRPRTPGAAMAIEETQSSR